MGINTVQDLKDAPPSTMRAHFGVVLERTCNELRGISCLELEEVAPARKEIVSSRSFGAMVMTAAELGESISTYAARAGERLQPRGSAVNNSNTAAAIGNIFDRLAASSLLSKVPFGKSLQEPIQNIAVGFKSSAAMNVPKALAGNALQRAAGRPVGLAMSPAVLMKQQEEN